MSLAVLAASACALVGLPVQAGASVTPGATPAGAAPAAAASGPVDPRLRPDLIDEAEQGRDAIAALGDDLDVAAARTGISERKLAHVLRTDELAWVDPDGQLYFVEENPSPTELSGGEPAPAAAYTTGETFALHSKPGSARTIFLDFDGATVQNTAWNPKIPNGTWSGYDNDGNPGSFTAGEHANIQEIWRQVAETYAPFDVDVTTQDPGTAALWRTSSSDTVFGTAVVITSSPEPRSAVCGSCLGVAYLGTFDSTSTSGHYQPAWVFNYSKTFNPMVIAQAASHEAGHNLGLNHDGTATASYYGGTSTWGPVMGSSRTRAISQWSRGEYAGASNTEDDFATITANGLAYRADEAGGTTATAKALGSAASYTADGVVASRTDADLYAVTLSCATTLSATVRGIGAQTALDLSLDLLDSAGALVTRNSPASGSAGSPPVSTGMDAAVSAPLAAGTYYLRVDGVGNGDPANGGWSDFGSVGQYRLTASGCGGTGTSGGTGSGAGGATPTSPPPTTQPPTTQPPTSSPRVTRPSAPRVRWVWSGKRGGRKTAVVSWVAPASNGGAVVRGYRLRAERLSRGGRVTRVVTLNAASAGSRAAEVALPRGRYAFRVVAWNAAGWSAWSPRSRAVTPR